MHIISMLIVSLLLLAGSDPAWSQVRRCPDARTAAGECVNPQLADSIRRQAIVSAQPKISYTAPPYLPYKDRDYFITRDYNEIGALRTAPIGAITTLP
jgi:hypothetical protein